MNKLEKRIHDFILGMDNSLTSKEAESIACVTAKIGLDVAEKAFRAGRMFQHDEDYHNFDQFKQEIL